MGITDVMEDEHIVHIHTYYYELYTHNYYIQLKVTRRCGWWDTSGQNCPGIEDEAQATVNG